MTLAESNLDVYQGFLSFLRAILDFEDYVYRTD